MDNSDEIFEQMASVTSMLTNAALGMVLDRARDVAATEPGSKERDDAVEILAERIKSFDEASEQAHSWMQRMRFRDLYGWAKESEYEKRYREGDGIYGDQGR